MILLYYDTYMQQNSINYDTYNKYILLEWKLHRALGPFACHKLMFHGCWWSNYREIFPQPSDLEQYFLTWNLISFRFIMKKNIYIWSNWKK